jgi:hypothetical protein
MLRILDESRRLAAKKSTPCRCVESSRADYAVWIDATAASPTPLDPRLFAGATPVASGGRATTGSRCTRMADFPGELLRGASMRRVVI